MLQDSAAVFVYRSMPEVSRYQSWEPKSADEIDKFIGETSMVEFGTHDIWFQLVILLRESGRIIGDIGINFPSRLPEQVELGITIAPEYQRRGYAREALYVIIEFLFLQMGVHRIYASIDPRNEPSLELMQRLGLREEGHFRKSLYLRGEWVDDIIFALLSEEWENQHE